MSAIAILIIILLVIIVGFAAAFGVYYQLYTNYECDTCPAPIVCPKEKQCPAEKECPAPIVCPVEKECAPNEKECPIPTPTVCPPTPTCPEQTVCPPTTQCPPTVTCTPCNTTVERTFTRYTGKDLSGGDITSKITTGETECLNLCKAESTCNAALLDSDGKLCYLKRNGATQTPLASDPRRILFIQDKK